MLQAAGDGGPAAVRLMEAPTCGAADCLLSGSDYLAMETLLLHPMAPRPRGEAV